MRGPLDRPLLQFLFHGHLWLAIGAMAQVWWIGTFTGSTGPEQVIAVGASVVAVYGMMRIVRSFEQGPHPSPGIVWTERFRGVMVALVLLAAGVGSILVFGSRRAYAPWDLIALPLVLLYLIPLRDKAGRSMGLRRLPLMKSPVIAGVWALAVTGLASATGEIPWHTVLPFTAIQFGFFFAVAVASDLVDLQHDDADLRTLPQVFGVRLARGLAVLGLLPAMLWMVVLMLLYPGTSGPDLKYVLPLVGYLVVGLVVLRAGPERPCWYVPVVLDGSLLVVPLLAFMAGVR